MGGSRIPAFEKKGKWCGGARTWKIRGRLCESCSLLCWENQKCQDRKIMVTFFLQIGASLSYRLRKITVRGKVEKCPYNALSMKYHYFQVTGIISIVPRPNKLSHDQLVDVFGVITAPDPPQLKWSWLYFRNLFRTVRLPQIIFVNFSRVQ
jgi:hypothetical protein